MISDFKQNGQRLVRDVTHVVQAKIQSHLNKLLDLQ